MNVFLLLELVDPQINAFFSFLWSTLGEESKPKRAHITLRGPYKNIVPQKIFNTSKKLLQYDVLTIYSIGLFINDVEKVVYFKVKSPNLREAWWKPDYPIGKYGFEPHISVYRGTDEEFAKKIYSFLLNENIELLCAEHRIIINKVHEGSLFSQDYRIGGDFNLLIQSGRLSKSFKERFLGMVISYKDNHPTIAST
jgi:hypothetical protein